MDFIITFFRDILDGPLYIVVCVICGILICSCIGYLGEQYLNKKKAQDEFNNTHATVSNDDVQNENPAPAAQASAPAAGQPSVTVPTNPGQ